MASVETSVNSGAHTAILLVNVGTPDSSGVADVRRYLGEFLNDDRVIDLPWLARRVLVNGIIVPFRAPKSAKLYQSLWTDLGSPLLFHSHAFANALQGKMGDKFAVHVAMRYGNPSISKKIGTIMEQGCRRLIIVPMFPHYASSTTGTAMEEAMRILGGMNVIPEIASLGQFFEEPEFLYAVTARVRAARPTEYDFVLFSYHGLPKRHVERTHPGRRCEQIGCATHYGAENRYCYQAACHRTTRLLATALGLEDGKYGTAFQSRLGKGWIQPFSDNEVVRLAKRGVKNLLVVSPAFVADCLETTIEIGHEYRQLFVNNGGQTLTLVDSLNDLPLWVDGFAGLLARRFGLDV